MNTNAAFRNYHVRVSFTDGTSLTKSIFVSILDFDAIGFGSRTFANYYLRLHAADVFDGKKVRHISIGKGRSAVNVRRRCLSLPEPTEADKAAITLLREANDARRNARAKVAECTTP